MKKVTAILLISVLLIGDMPVKIVYGKDEPSFNKTTLGDYTDGSTTPGSTTPSEVTTPGETQRNVKLNGIVRHLKESDKKKNDTKEYEGIDNATVRVWRVDSNKQVIDKDPCKEIETKDKGKFFLELKSNENYCIEITHDNFKTKKEYINLNNSVDKTYELEYKDDDTTFAFQNVSGTYVLNNNQETAIENIYATTSEKNVTVTYEIKVEDESTRKNVVLQNCCECKLLLKDKTKFRICATRKATTNYREKTIETDWITVERDTLGSMSFEDTAPTVEYSKVHEYKNILNESKPDKGTVTYRIIEQRDLQGTESQSVAEINAETGVVKVKGTGTVKICAEKTQEKYDDIKAEYTLKINKGEKVINFSAKMKNQFIYDSKEQIYTAVYRTSPYELGVVDNDGNSVENVTYTVSDTQLAEITTDNQLKLKSGEGEVKITACYAGDSNFNSKSVEFTLRLVKQKQEQFLLSKGNDITISYNNEEDGEKNVFSNVVVNEESPVDNPITYNIINQYTLENVESDGIVEWLNTNEGNGKLKILRSGLVKIKVSRQGNDCYADNETTYKLKINKAEQKPLEFKSGNNMIVKEQNGSYETKIAYSEAQEYELNVSGGSAKNEVQYSIPEEYKDIAILIQKKDTKDNTITRTYIKTLKTGKFQVIAAKTGDDCYENVSSTLWVETVKAEQPAFTLNTQPETTYEQGGIFCNPTTYGDAKVSEQVEELKSHYEIKEQTTLEGDKIEYKDEPVVYMLDANEGTMLLNTSGIVTVEVWKEGNDNYKNTPKQTFVLTIKRATQKEVDFASSKLTIKKVSVDESGKVVQIGNGILGVRYQDTSVRGGNGDGEYQLSYDATSLSLNQKVQELQLKQVGEYSITGQKGIDRRYLASNVAELKITVDYEPTPDNPYTVVGNRSATGWYYDGEVAIVPKEGYKISDTCSVDADWSDKYVLPEANTEDKIIYLRNTENGGITAAITIPANEILIDKSAPENLTITYDRSPIAEVLEKITFGYYNAPVYATISATDATSGLQSFTYSYIVEEGASSTNKGNENVKVELNGANSYTFEIPAQFKGNVMFEAVDKAGNTSMCSDNEKGIVVDTIAPSVTICYTGNLVDTVNQNKNSVSEKNDTTRFMYNSDLTVQVFVNEANFKENNIDIAVIKDGNVTVDYVQSGWKKIEGDTYCKTFTLSADGTYRIMASGVDTAGQKMEWSSSEYDGKTGTYEYISNELIIDKTAPVVTVSYDVNTPVRDNMFNVARTATIQVIDRNFRPEDVELTVFQATDGTGNRIAEFNQETVKQQLKQWYAWTKVSDGSRAEEVWEAKISYNVDAHYQFALRCMDMADNKAIDSCAADFYVDRTAPEASSMKVTYSTPLFSKVLQTVTFGYYKPSVTVTLEAEDVVTCVESFTWSYQKEAGASSVNVLTEGTEIPVTSVNGLKSTATFTLTAEEAKQYRGNISFTATDKIGNISSLTKDAATTLVVDTIAPECKVTYNQPAQTIKTSTTMKQYYSENVTAAISITEANFYKEDIEIKVNGEDTKLNGSWKQSGDAWTNTITLKEDGKYQITISYKDRSNNKMHTYASDTIIIDKVKPVVKVDYTNKQAVQTNNGRTYYDASQQAVLKVTEHNFRAKDIEVTVTAEDVAGNAVEVKDYNSYFKNADNWTKDGDVYTAEISFSIDANYTFDISYKDLAQNKATAYETDTFTVDKNEPENLSISYSVSVFEEVLERITFGYYNAKATVTITAEDITSPIQTFCYSYLKANGVSSINKELVEIEVKAEDITYSEDNGEATIKFDVLKTALDSQNQFNGTVSFTAKDYAGNESNLEGDRRLIVDTIAPTAEITYNTPIATENGVSYYDGEVEAQIVVGEANFDAQDVVVDVTKDGKAYAVTPSWTDSSTDTHTGSVSIAEDGDYVITVNYEDKSTNAMQEYVSEQLTVDTQIEAPKITMNGQNANGMAYQKDAVLGIQFSDTNFAEYQIVLTKTDASGASKDVTEQFITGMTVNEQGGHGTFDTFEKTQENDGVYRLSVTVKDKAGNEVVSEVAFTLNRFGSVYEYNESLVELQNKYVKSVEEDLVITEYNPTELLPDSVQINITRDGKAVEVPNVEVKVVQNAQTQGESGWYQYQYRIAASNFESDGVYKIVVSSKDAAGNAPENASVKERKIQFSVDSHAPEITSISGLEDTVVNAQSVQVNYTVFDAISLKNIKVFVDNEVVENVTDFTADANSYNGTFTVGESNSSREVRLVVEDKAGNVTDTSSEYFTSVYAFNSKITVSTNAFIRWYANKTLVFASVGGGVAAVAVFTMGIRFYKKKKRFPKVKK